MTHQTIIRPLKSVLLVSGLQSSTLEKQIIIGEANRALCQ